MTWRDLAVLIGGLAAVGVAAVVLRAIPGVTDTTGAMVFLLVVVGTGAVTRFWIAAFVSLQAMLTFNYLFIPPVGTFRIADPGNWITLLAFLAVALTASQVSSAAQSRLRETEARERATLASALLASLAH